MKTRKYRQRRRAEQTDATRRQIVEATVALHEELGPARTSIKAIAERAGVQRLTVYRHFPDDASIFEACTSHWLDSHPLPVMSDWEDIKNPEQRTGRALLEFYRYYRNTERMWLVTYRDINDVAALQKPISAVAAYLDRVRDDLLTCWNVSSDRKKAISITLGHCLQFTTWYSLKCKKLSDRKIVELVTGWLSFWSSNTL